MQVDTLFLTTDELNTLYFNGAGPLSDDVQGAIRLFQSTVESTEARYNRAVNAQMGLVEGAEPQKLYRARIHVHFVVEPA